MRSKFAIAGLLLAACTLARAVVPLTGIGTNGTLTWEQLRFYGPSGGTSTTYAGGQPKQIASLLPGASDLCTDADICGSTLRFNTQFGGAVTATATTTAGGSAATAIVRQDLSPRYGGLGVQGYTPASSTQTWAWKSTTPKSLRIPSNINKPAYGSYKTVTTPAKFWGNDEINAGESLTLSFEKTVRVLGFHFFDADHKQTKLAGDFYGLSVDGGPKVNYSFLGGFPFNAASTLIGHSFTFSFSSTKYESFYLGAIKFAQVIATPVPESTTLAMMLAGLMVIAGVARRRASRGLVLRRNSAEPGQIRSHLSPTSALASG